MSIYANQPQLNGLKQYLRKKIDGLNSYIQSIEELLPYADGKAYNQDKDKVKAMRNEQTRYRAWLCAIENMEEDLKHATEDFSDHTG